jgi:hypothetical protein
MTEREFWLALEFRICDEFAGLPEGRYRRFWCDGFIPADYLLGDSPPRIRGRVWIVDGQAQANWAFTLLLPQRYPSRDEIDWASLLPPPGVTKWMGFDEDRQHLEIEPSAAVPDLT